MHFSYLGPASYDLIFHILSSSLTTGSSIGSGCCCFCSVASHVQPFATPWTAAHQTSLTFTISWSLLKLMSIESVMPSNHLILCCPHRLLPSIFPSIRVFSNESALHTRWPKYWSFSISPFSEYSGLIFFRIHWFDLPAVQFLKVHFLYIGKCKRLGSLKFF